MMTGCLPGRGETANSTWGFAAANLGSRDLMKPLPARQHTQGRAPGVAWTHLIPRELPAQSQ